MIEIEDITAGQSYACHFRVRTFVYANGTVADTQGLQPGEPIPQGAQPGEYRGFGVITVRDVQNRLLKIWDTDLEREWTVSWSDVWDCDTVSWQDTAEE